jgi:predicted RNA methylase
VVLMAALAFNAWSNSDYPYMCLIDSVRTEAFARAIQTTVKPGMVVADIGSGSGILAMCAVRAGAERVYAVEQDPLLARCLRETIAANGYEQWVKVHEADAMSVDLPRVDAVLAELIETALIDEMQVPVLNRLARAQISSSSTVFVPRSYRTRVSLAEIDETFYGFTFRVLRHEWPFYDLGGLGWYPRNVSVVSAVTEVWSGSFGAGMLEEEVSVTREVDVAVGSHMNALVLEGTVELAAGICLGATNSMNGMKIVPIEKRIAESVPARFALSYRMGGGLDTLRFQWL